MSRNKIKLAVCIAMAALVVCSAGCDVSKMFYQKNEVTVTKETTAVPGESTQDEPEWMNAELETASLEVSLSWKDTDGNAMDWPGVIEGIGIWIMQSINGSEPAQIRRVLLTAAQPSQTVEELPSYKKLPSGEDYTYAYTVEEINGEAYLPEYRQSGDGSTGWTAKVTNTASQDGTGQIIQYVVKEYERGDLTMQVDYWEIIQREIYNCTNVEDFKDFINQFSGSVTSSGKKIYNYCLLLSPSQTTYPKPSGGSRYTCDSDLLNCETYTGSLTENETVSCAKNNRDYYDKNIKEVDSTRTEMIFDNYLNENLLRSEEIINDEDGEGNSVLAFTNFRTPEREINVSNPSNETQVFRYINKNIGLPMFNKKFYFNKWKEERIYKKYYYNVKKICITKPSTCKYDESSFEFKQTGDRLLRVYYSGDKMYILLADQEENPITGVIAEFDVLDYNNHQERSHIIVRFD